MSADNWIVCPECMKKRAAANAAIVEKRNIAYETLPAKEWELFKLQHPTPSELAEEFREDFEIGFRTDGTFYVGYRGECQSCGFLYRFTNLDAAPKSQVKKV